MFPPNTEVTQVPTMISPQNNNGIIGFPGFFKRIQNLPHLCVYITDASEIGMTKLSRIGIR